MKKLRSLLLSILILACLSSELLATTDKYYSEYQKIRHANPIQKEELNALISYSVALSDKSALAEIYIALLHSNVNHPTGFEEYKVAPYSKISSLKLSQPHLYYRHNILFAYNYVVKGEWENAYAAIDAIINYSKGNPDELYFDAMAAKAEFLSRAGLYMASLNIYSEVLNSLPRLNQKEFYGAGNIETVNLNIGLTMSLMKKYESAINLCTKAKSFFEAAPIGAPVRSYQIALDCLRRSYKGVEEHQKADNILELYIDYAKQVKDWDTYAYSLVLRAEHLQSKDKHVEAYQLIQQHVAFISSLPLSYDTVSYKIALFKALLNNNEISEANRISEELDIAINQIPNSELLLAEYNSYKSTLYNALGDKQSALIFLRKSQAFFKELYSVSNNDIEVFSGFYEREIAERKLELLEKEHELAELKLSNTKTLNTILTYGAIILTVCLFFISFLYKQQKRLKLEQQELASLDMLTGVRNRRSIMEAIHQEVEIARRYQLPVALVLIDLDNFKTVNDEFGHLVGDEVLKKFAQQVNKSIRKSDVFGRYGGEEFILCLPMTGLNEAEKMVNDILENYATTHIIDDIPKQSFSAGISIFQPNLSVADLINLSDEALYKAKELGRNQVCNANQTKNGPLTKVNY